MRNPYKRTSAGLTVMAVLLALNTGTAHPDTPALPFVSGKITYSVKKGSASGVSTFSWTEHGRRFRQELTLTVPVDKKPVTDSGWSVGDATQIFAHQGWMDKEVYRYRVPQDLAVASPIGVPVFGIPRDIGKPMGTANVLGKVCELHQINKLKLWLWQGLPLRSEGTAGPGPSLSLMATKIDTSAPLPEKLFSVPKGYTVSESPVQAAPDGTGK